MVIHNLNYKSNQHKLMIKINRELVILFNSLRIKCSDLDYSIKLLDHFKFTLFFFSCIFYSIKIRG